MSGQSGCKDQAISKAPPHTVSDDPQEHDLESSLTMDLFDLISALTKALEFDDLESDVTKALADDDFENNLTMALRANDHTGDHEGLLTIALAR